jgi:hypothetical protein
MKVALFLLRVAVLVAMWYVLGTVAQFTLGMWQTWAVIVCISFYSALSHVNNK